MPSSNAAAFDGSGIVSLGVGARLTAVVVCSVVVRAGVFRGVVVRGVAAGFVSVVRLEQTPQLPPCLAQWPHELQDEQARQPADPVHRAIFAELAGTRVNRTAPTRMSERLNMMVPFGISGDSLLHGRRLYAPYRDFSSRYAALIKPIPTQTLAHGRCRQTIPRELC
jgi:hypothetical protein